MKRELFSPKKESNLPTVVRIINDFLINYRIG